MIKLTESELYNIKHLKTMFQNLSFPLKTRMKVWEEIKEFWKLIEYKYNLSILNIKEMKSDGTLILK